MCMTAKMIEQARPGQTISDGKNSLYLRVQASGTRSFFVKKRYSKTHSLTKTIGHWPEMTLKEARVQAKALCESVSTVRIRKEFCELCNEWLQHKAESGVLHMEAIITALRPLTSAFKGKYFDQITPPMVKVVMDKFTCGNTRKRVQARRAAAYLKSVEKWAVNLGYIDYYRLSGINEILVPTRVRHFTSITPKELPIVCKAIRAHGAIGTTYWDLVRAGLYTLLRPGEYSVMRWDWIDEAAGIITVPANVMKMKKVFTFPITTQMSALLRERKAAGILSDYVFPAVRNNRRPASKQLLKTWFVRQNINDMLVPHGIRAIGRTFMEENGIDHATAELCLSHTTGSQTELAYNRSDRMESRRQAMQSWCDYAESCLFSLN